MKLVTKSKEPSVYEVMTWLEKQERKPFMKASEEDHWNRSLVRQVRRQSVKNLGFEIEISHVVRAMTQGRWLLASMYSSAALNQIDPMVQPEKWLIYAFLEIEAKLAQGQNELAMNCSVMCAYNLSDWVGWDHSCTRAAVLRASGFKARSEMVQKLVQTAKDKMKRNAVAPPRSIL